MVSSVGMDVLRGAVGKMRAAAFSCRTGEAGECYGVFVMIVYTKSHCGWCRAALAWLDGHGYRYEVREVLGDPAAYARMREISGQSLAPTLEVDGKVLADFDTDQLEDFLAANGIKP